MIPSYYKNAFKGARITLVPTGKCNAACPHCSASRLPKMEMDIREARRLIPRLARLSGRRKAFIFGGEPMLHKDFNEILTITAQNFKSVKLDTNASQLKSLKRARAFVRSLPHNVDVNLGVGTLHFQPSKHAPIGKLAVKAGNACRNGAKRLLLASSILNSSINGPRITILHRYTPLEAKTKFGGKERLDAEAAFNEAAEALRDPKAVAAMRAGVKSGLINVGSNIINPTGRASQFFDEAGIRNGARGFTTTQAHEHVQGKPEILVLPNWDMYLSGGVSGIHDLPVDYLGNLKTDDFFGIAKRTINARVMVSERDKRAAELGDIWVARAKGPKQQAKGQ